MATAKFYVHLVPEFSDKAHQKLRKVKATEIRQSPPVPGTTGLWIEINIDTPDAVFVHLVPKLNAKMSDAAIEAMLVESSELHTRLVGMAEDDQVDP